MEGELEVPPGLPLAERKRSVYQVDLPPSELDDIALALAGVVGRGDGQTPVPVELPLSLWAGRDGLSPAGRPDRPQARISGMIPVLSEKLSAGTSS